MNLQKYAPFTIIIALLLWATYLAVEITAFQQEVDNFKHEVSAVVSEREAIKEKFEAAYPVMVVCEPPSAQQPDFIPLDINLDIDLQRHAWEMCQREDIPYPVFAAIMWGESRHIPDVPDNLNTNGTLDRGLCQINEVNWDWLAEDYGLDVSDPYDNIEAGAIILSMFWHKYPPEQALTAYAWGEQGMLNADCTAPSAYRVLETAESYGYKEE